MRINYYLIFCIFLYSTKTLYAEDFTKVKIEKPGEILKQEEFKELGIQKILFSNNVVLNIKKNDAEKDTIIFQLNFGSGALSAPKGKEALVHFGQPMFMNGGLKNTTDKELKAAIAGKNISAQFIVLENSFRINSKTTSKDLELNLQFCRAKLIDSAFPEEIFANIKVSFDNTYKALKTEMPEYFKNAVKRKITGNNNALSLPERTIIDALTVKDLNDWLTNEFINAPLEINIVGDLDEKKIIEFVAKYFGSLPKRQSIKLFEKTTPHSIEKFELVENFDTLLKKDMLFMIIPTVDYHEMNETRKLYLLGKILKEKINKQFQLKSQTSISLDIEHFYNEDINSICYFRFAAIIPPEKTAALKEAINSTIKEIAEKGITKSDLDEIRKPFLEKISAFSKTNSYWLNNVMRDSTSDPKNLELAITFPKHYEEVSVQQINEISKKYLDLNKISSYLLKAIEIKK